MILRKIDDFLNSFTMYRILAYGLSLLAVICLLFSALGVLSLPLSGMAASLVILLMSCYSVNYCMAKAWNVTANSESWFITALILFFILPQATTLIKAAAILLAGILAMASKYMIARAGKHIFNPAAFAATFLGLFSLLNSTWWIGNTILWPFTLVYGLLVVRKICRFPLVISFAVVSLLVVIIMASTQHVDPHVEYSGALKQAILASPLIFLGTIMLTEPATMPPLRRQQIIFGGVVGLLYATHWTIAGVFVYPELALLVGNVYAFTVSPKYRLRLKLKAIQKISDRVYNYVFIPDHKLAFEAGQYLEWTLDHRYGHTQDNEHGKRDGRGDGRGNRRTFTIASSPTEDTIQLGVKYYEPSSSYKKSLEHMQVGDSLFAGQLAGNFTLPSDTAKKLVFIAGGIGITPFRSMITYALDTEEKRDIVLFYIVPHSDEIAYKDVLKRATKAGIRVISVVTNPKKDPTWKGVSGRLDKKLLAKEVPDYRKRTFYVSGPQSLVENYQAMLTQTGIHRNRIETDYFSGY